MIIRWSIPVPMDAMIPAIDDKSSCHLMSAATPRIMMISLMEVPTIGIKIPGLLYLK